MNGSSGPEAEGDCPGGRTRSADGVVLEGAHLLGSTAEPTPPQPDELQQTEANPASLRRRYADWEGRDPEPADESAWADAGFNPDSRWSGRGHSRFVDRVGGGDLGVGGGGADGGGGGF